jgi:hypothetical protein
MLQESERRSHQDPDWNKGFQEFAERTRHRLESREIISKAVYDQKFHSGQVQAK